MSLKTRGSQLKRGLKLDQARRERIRKTTLLKLIAKVFDWSSDIATSAELIQKTRKIRQSSRKVYFKSRGLLSKNQVYIYTVKRPTNTAFCQSTFRWRSPTSLHYHKGLHP